MALIKLPEEELKKLAKMSVRRNLHELRKKGIEHAIVANPDNPEKQRIYSSKEYNEEDLYWFWRNRKKAELIIIYTMEDCVTLKTTKPLRRN